MTQSKDPAAVAPPLRLAGVTKSIAGRPVLHGVDLECTPGMITALLGPNGAGKTTTVSIATGLRRPQTGAAEVFGRDAASAAAKSLFSAVPQDAGLPSTVRVNECLDFVARQRPTSSLADPLDAICAHFGIQDLLPRQAGGLSGGERRRVFLALGFVRVPGLLILDEATTDLDEALRAHTWRSVRRYADRGGAVLATSHILADVEANADRVIAMADGRVVQRGSVADIRRLLGGSVVSIRLDPRDVSVVVDGVHRAGLGEPRNGSELNLDNRTGDITINWRSDNPVELVSLLATLGRDVRELKVAPIPLGDLLTGTASASSPAR